MLRSNQHGKPPQTTWLSNEKHHAEGASIAQLNIALLVRHTQSNGSTSQAKALVFSRDVQWKKISVQTALTVSTLCSIPRMRSMNYFFTLQSCNRSWLALFAAKFIFKSFTKTLACLGRAYQGTVPGRSGTPGPTELLCPRGTATVQAVCIQLLAPCFLPCDRNASLHRDHFRSERIGHLTDWATAGATSSPWWSFRQLAAVSMAHLTNSESGTSVQA